MDFQSFQHSHSAMISNIPQLYWRALYEKLQYEVYDAGKYFSLSRDQDSWEVVVSNTAGLNLDDPACIFLVDHAWTFQPECAQKQLQMISGLGARIAALLGLTDEKDEGAEEGEELYDADSESGNEKEEWSNSDDDAIVDQAVPDIPTDVGHTHPNIQLRNDEDDGCGSGDLGDVSHAYVTDGPDRDEYNSSPEITRKDELPGGGGGGDKGCGLKTKEGGGVHMYKMVDPDSGEVIKEDVTISLPSEDLVEKILRNMWPYCHSYTISNSPVPMWYINDEFGSRIQHSLDPTVAMTSFFYIPTQLAFSVFWPIKELKHADLVRCNYLSKCFQPGLDQACHSLPWSHDHHISLDDPLWNELDKFVVPRLEERCNEEIPDPATPSPSPMLNYSVYTDMKAVKGFLTHPSFHFVSSKREADILWLMEHFKHFKSLQTDQFINQFSCENVLTCKDLLVTVAKRGNGGDFPSWLPLTFNLLYELPKFIRSYLEREEKGEDNVWILKPWNLGRGLDIHITDNLIQIIRLGQSGFKVASKYITRPVLFHRPEVGRVKFDYRYMILLTSVKPLEAYIYNVFWLRFANKPFNLENMTDYETHFTVMNYVPGGNLKQIHYNDFIPLFEEQNKDYKWADIEQQTCQLLKELLTSASVSGSPPETFAPFGQSRAIYAADLMLEQMESESGSLPRYQPRLLEINYCPDCDRACKYHPDFFNHMFQVLFMGTTEGLPVTKIT